MQRLTISDLDKFSTHDDKKKYIRKLLGTTAESFTRYICTKVPHQEGYVFEFFSIILPYYTSKEILALSDYKELLYDLRVSVVLYHAINQDKNLLKQAKPSQIFSATCGAATAVKSDADFQHWLALPCGSNQILKAATLKYLGGLLGLLENQPLSGMLLAQFSALFADKRMYETFRLDGKSLQKLLSKTSDQNIHYFAQAIGESSVLWENLQATNSTVGALHSLHPLFAKKINDELFAKMFSTYSSIEEGISKNLFWLGIILFYYADEIVNASSEEINSFREKYDPLYSLEENPQHTFKKSESPLCEQYFLVMQQLSSEQRIHLNARLEKEFLSKIKKMDISEEDISRVPSLPVYQLACLSILYPASREKVKSFWSKKNNLLGSWMLSESVLQQLCRLGGAQALVKLCEDFPVFLAKSSDDLFAHTFMKKFISSLRGHSWDVTLFSHESLVCVHESNISALIDAFRSKFDVHFDSYYSALKSKKLR